MKNDLTCAVARDLMPSCADGLASKDTNEALRRHTETCEACRAAFEKMKAPENTPATEKEKTEIAYLKKVNKKRLTVAVCAALAAALLAAVVFGAVTAARVFKKQPVTYGELEVFSLEVTNENGCRVLLSGQLPDGTAPAKGGKTVFDPATGRVTFTLFSRRALPKETQVVTADFSTDSEIRSVYLDDVPLWEDGVRIGDRAARVFAAAHPYMGDITQNLESAKALDIGKEYGGFQNELITSHTPYAWTLIFTDDFAAEHSAYHLPEDQILLLATIGNLDAVCFRFPGTDETGADAREVTLTVEDANRLTGMDIKEAGKTPAGVQALADKARAIMSLTSSSVFPEE